eukprot:COSAG06_NODE_26358_length_616_cov_1.673114_2_plen_31_part_01
MKLALKRSGSAGSGATSPCVCAAQAAILGDN